MYYPVEDAPLAFCMRDSVGEEDLVPCDIVGSDYVGEIYHLNYNLRQKWCWIPEQRPDELSLFMSFDSSPVNASPCE